MDFAEVKRRLKGLDTACICDARKTVRVFDPAIRPLSSGLKLIGKARTVRCRNDFLTVVQALGEAGEDDVLVIDGQGGEKALAGELFCTEAIRRGLAGIVIDGACRDSRTLRQLALPIYARAILPAAGTAIQICEQQIAITCGGVTVEPGDIVFGDDDGLIVTTMKELEETLPIAEEIQRKETVVLERLNEGESLFEMLNLLEHTANVSSKIDSK
ncbi:MAG TPA: RraA family protein [Candidatus Obscuribacterales bacterium]